MLKGSIVALVTPFHEDGTVNFEKLGELLDWQIENRWNLDFRNIGRK